MEPTLTLEVTAYTLEQIPDFPEPRIALVGRSNVGKSSLLNALANRKSLAKISSTPGKTRSINLYKVQEGNFYLADLPGYGYAQCSKEERKIWHKLIENYLTPSPTLMGVALLIDVRVPPQILDKDMVNFAHNQGIPLLPVLTKADKCKQAECAARQQEWKKLLHGVQPLITSSEKKTGLKQLWQELFRMAGQEYSPL